MDTTSAVSHMSHKHRDEFTANPDEKLALTKTEKWSIFVLFRILKCAIKPKKVEKVVRKRQETRPMTSHLLRCHCSHSFHPRFRRSLLPLPHCRAWWLLSNGYRLLCHNVLWLDRSRFLCLFFCLFLLLK